MRMTVATAVAIALVTSTHGKDAEAAMRRPTNIEAQSLNTALQTLAKQRDIQLVYRSELANDRNTTGAAGDLTLEETLTKLLNGSGLTFQYLDDKAITIVPVAPAAPAKTVTNVTSASAETPQTVDTSLWSRLRLTQAESPSPRTEEGRGEDEKVEVYKPTAGKGIPEVLVRGSRSTNVDIRRTRDDVQPFVVFEGEQIARANAPNLETFLKSQLPMNAASLDLQQMTDTPAGTAQGSVNLRGLGTNQTLILVDGRRLPGVSGIGSGFEQTDISGIPLSSIERIEVLPATASAIYGGAATGGVINIIRKRDYAGLDVGIKYGNTFDNHARATSYYLNGGAAFNENRTSVTFSAARSESSPLLVTDRDFASRSRALQLENNPAVIADSFFPLSSSRPNICSAIQFTPTVGFCGGDALALDSGAALGASITSVPRGYAGPESDAAAALLTNAGKYNIEVPEDKEYLLRTPSSISLSGSARQSLNSWLEFQLNGSSNRYVSDLSSGNGSASILVPADSLNNPFQQPVVVNVPLAGLSRKGHSNSEVAEAAASLITRLPGGWSASIDRSWGRTVTSYKYKGGNLISNAGLAFLSQSPRLFQGNGTNGLDISGYLLPDYDVFSGPYTQVAEGTALRVSGPLVQLPAGALTLTALAEHRGERTRDAFNDN